MAEKKGSGKSVRNGDVVLSPEFGQSTYKLFQLDEKMLSALENGEPMYLKGVADDALVLCTSSATYAIQLVETSNEVLLCSIPDLPAEGDALSSDPPPSRVVEGVVGSSHELKRTAPRLHRLQELLDLEPYSGPEDEFHLLQGWTGIETRAETSASQENTQTLEADADSAMEGGIGSDGASARTSHTPARKRPRGPLDGNLTSPRDGPGYTLEELNQLVQASMSEIIGGLSSVGAVLLQPIESIRVLAEMGVDVHRDGVGQEAEGMQARYRLLLPEYTRAVLLDILNTVMAEGWHPAAVPVRALCAALDQHPATVVTQVLHDHGSTGKAGASAAGAGAGAGAGSSMEEDECVALDYVSVALTRARALLEEVEDAAAASRARNAASGLPPSAGPLGAASMEYHAGVADFTRTWQRAVDTTWPSASPDGAPGMPASGSWSPVSLGMELLQAKGLVLVDSTATGVPILRHFPQDRLPHDPRARFQALFAARPRWTLADLTPYIAPLVGVDRKLDDMIVAQCRSTLQPDGSRIFSAREGHGPK